MNLASVGFKCSVHDCKEISYVSVANMIKAGKELIPNGWKYIDIGEVAEESYYLCDKHAGKWRQHKKDELRRFVDGGHSHDQHPRE